jgi:hypothetical protein
VKFRLGPADVGFYDEMVLGDPSEAPLESIFEVSG